MSEWNAGLALPEWILAAATMCVLWFDARTPADEKRRAVLCAWGGLILSLVVVVLQWIVLGLKQPADASIKWYAFRGHYGFDHFAALFKVLFGTTALLVLALARQWLRRVDRGHGEFHLLVLFATMGMFFVSSIEDFAGLFVSLELVTVSFFCLTAFKRNDERSIEAGIKYVVLGALASSFLLLGIAFLYGATGGLEFRRLAEGGYADTLAHGGNAAALLQFGVLLTLIGLGFKIAAVPFQVWTPDVYEGASSPVTAFLSMGSKAAGVVLLLKVVRACLGPEGNAGLAVATPWILLITVIAAATLLYGNLGAIWQSNIKRLLGYSSIGHAGYILMGLAAFDANGFTAILYYLMAYLWTVLGVFAVVVAVNGVTRSHRLADYAGLARRSPFLALVLTCGLLSLAGVPPFAGFFGKFLIFQAVVAKGTTTAYALAFVGAAGVVISLYYYLCVVRRLYMEEPIDGDRAGPIEVPARLKGVLYVCLAGIFLLGLVYEPFVQLARSAAESLIALV
jgi:NADH-quinone oxidoreductase subunit N